MPKRATSDSEAGRRGRIRADRRGVPASVRDEQVDPIHQLAFLEEVVDAAPIGLVLVDRQGGIVWANAWIQERLEAPLATLRGQSFAILAGPYARQREGRALAELVANGSGALEAIAFSREGMSFPCRVEAVHAFDGGRLLLAVHDTREFERIRTEALVRAETARREREILRLTGERIASGLIVLDDCERVLLVNRAAREVLGATAADARGRSLAEIDLPGPLRGKWLTFLASAADHTRLSIDAGAAGDAPALEIELIRIRSERGIPVGSLCFLERRQAAPAPRSDRRAPEHESAGALAHALRTPLASVQAFVDALLADPDVDPAVREEFLQLVAEEARRMGDAIETWLRPRDRA